MDHVITIVSESMFFETCSQLFWVMSAIQDEIFDYEYFVAMLINRISTSSRSLSIHHIALYQDVEFSNFVVNRNAHHFKLERKCFVFV